LLSTKDGLLNNEERLLLYILSWWTQKIKNVDENLG